MTRWEYCEAVWQPEVVPSTMLFPDEETVPWRPTRPSSGRRYAQLELMAGSWSAVPRCRFGDEYYFYFKSPAGRVSQTRRASASTLAKIRCCSARATCSATS